MQVQLTKIFTFEMAHALPGYDGACRNLHGHSFRLEVTISGIPLEQPGHPKNGMVMDFKDLKNIVKKSVIEIVDHALLLPESFAPELVAALRVQFEKVVTVPFQPTCEHVIVWFARQIQPNLPEHIRLRKLVLYETATSFATLEFD